jgi:hypothetical protein
MTDNTLSQNEVIAFLEAGVERVECVALFAKWKYPRPGYITRDLSNIQTSYRFTYTNDKGKSEYRQVFFHGFNPCTLYRV